MKILAACTAIIGCVMLANPAFAGDTRVYIDFGLFDHIRHDRHYDRHHHQRPVIIHHAPRVIYAPFGSSRHGLWHDNGRRGHDKHWKRNDRHHDRRQDHRRRDDHRDRRRHW